MSQAQLAVRPQSLSQPPRTVGSPKDAIPCWELILSGVDVKTATWSDAASLRTRLYDPPADSNDWDSQTLDLGVVGETGEKRIPYTFSVPPGIQAATLNTYIQKDFVGENSDHYMSAIAGQFGIEGAYGGFSGTLHAQFDMTEDTTQAYSFGTHTARWRLYSLKAPAGLDYTFEFLNEQFRADLYGDKAMPVQEFYTT